LIPAGRTGAAVHTGPKRQTLTKGHPYVGCHIHRILRGIDKTAAAQLPGDIQQMAKAELIAVHA